MSNEDLDVIREINSAVGSGHPRAVAGRVHPDVVWEHNIGMGSPEEGVYRGREDVLRLLERIVETWEYLHLVPRSIDRLDDGSYRVRGELRAKHRTSDTEIGATYEQRLELRDGVLVQGEMRTGEMSPS